MDSALISHGQKCPKSVTYSDTSSPLLHPISSLPRRQLRMAARSPYFATEESFRGIRQGESPAAALRRILASPGAHQAPCCFDALAARLVEQAGFPIAFMSGINS